ncbi:MAG: FecCD family ABC transporter permease [Thermacetogeniaceae bacterium]
MQVSTNGHQAVAEALYGRYVWRKVSFILVLAILLVLVAMVATATGASGISVRDVCCVIARKLVPGLHAVPRSEIAEAVVFDLRLPRIVLAILAGISLGGAGAVMQGVLRNPLVSPMTLGVSSGAAFGAALAILLGANLSAGSFIGRYEITIGAFVFGSMTMVVIYGISKIKGATPATLLLAGVAMSYLYSAGLSLLQYVSTNEALKAIVVWLMGGLWGASWTTDLVLLPIVVICTVILVSYSWDLNAFGAGEDVARGLGVNVRRLVNYSLALSTLITSSVIAFTGVIGFIGLIAPHICRMLIGNDHRFLIPSSCLTGAVLLLLADTVGRNILAPVEIPVGIVTSVLGVPFFIYLLLRQKQRWW